MKSTAPFFGLFMVIALTLVLSSASAVPTANTAVTNANPTGLQIITLRKGEDLDGLISEYGLQPKDRHRWHALNIFAIHLDDTTRQKLKQDHRILAVEEDGIVVPAAQTVGTGLIRMGITNFPVAHIDGSNNMVNVDVAVLDTGVGPHPDLNIFQSVGFADTNYEGVTLNGNDWYGHGTHVAGIIGAMDNSFGVVGVAPGIRIWSVQVIGPTQSSWANNVIPGFDYVSTNANRISVVNVSFGSTGESPYNSINAAVQNLVDQGVVFVAAAGNTAQDLAGPDGVYGSNDDILPAALPEVMAVSGMDPFNDPSDSGTDVMWEVSTNEGSNFSKISRELYGFTNYVQSPGGTIDVAAPGVNIYSSYTYISNSTTTQTYAYETGTSMASPHVAGLVALYIAANGRATNAAGVYAIRQAIVNNSLPQSQWNNPTNTNPLVNGVQPLPAPLAMPSTNWVPQPTIAGVTNTPGGLQLTVPAVPGYNYTAQYANALSHSNNWTNLATVTGAGSISNMTLTDTNPGNQRFYRLARQPAP